MEREEHGENSDREDSERELSRVAHLPIDEEPADGPGGDDDERCDWEAAHHSHLRRCGGGGSPVGLSQSIRRLSWHSHALCLSKA